MNRLSVARCLRMAAEMVDRTSCSISPALFWHTYLFTCETETRAADVMQVWFMNLGDLFDSKQHRVLALLFAAEMVEGDL